MGFFNMFFNKEEETEYGHSEKDYEEEEYVKEFVATNGFTEDIYSRDDNIYPEVETTKPKQDYIEPKLNTFKKRNNIDMKFFKPRNSNDINNILHYIRDNNPVVIINISKLTTGSGIEATKVLLSKVKKTLQVQGGSIFSFDTEFVICLPKGTRMHKTQIPIPEPTPVDTTPLDVFGEANEFARFIDFSSKRKQ